MRTKIENFCSNPEKKVIGLREDFYTNTRQTLKITDNSTIAEGFCFEKTEIINVDFSLA